MRPDIDKYRRFVDRYDLSDDAKVELLQAVWHIVEGFVDRAFGHDSHSLAMRGSEKIAAGSEKLVDCSGMQLTAEFTVANMKEMKNPQ